MMEKYDAPVRHRSEQPTLFTPTLAYPLYSYNLTESSAILLFIPSQQIDNLKKKRREAVFVPGVLHKYQLSKTARTPINFTAQFLFTTSHVLGNWL